MQGVSLFGSCISGHALSSPGHVPMMTQALGEKIIQSARNKINIKEIASLAHLVHTGMSAADAEADTMSGEIFLEPVLT